MRIGRIAGIEVTISWSWFVLFVLVAWTLAAGVFPASSPHRSVGEYIVMGATGTAALFASLLAHEFGHAMQARREHVDIDGVRLWLLGGIAQMRSGFPSPGAELRIAAAGPAVSLLLGVVFVAAGLIAVLPPAVSVVLTWLGVVNLTLLVFNLLPSLPLDGGRLLHALLWRRTGDRDRATVDAASTARGIAIIIAGLGILSFVSTGSIGGLWLALVAWFLLAASGAEAQHARAHHALGDLRIRDLMLTDPVMVEGTSTLAEFVDLATYDGRYSTYPVVEDGRVTGLFPFRAITRTPRRDWATTFVHDAAIPYDQVPTVNRETTATDALDLLAASSPQRAFVVEDGQVVGFLSITDIARLISDRSDGRHRVLTS